ncbi:MAG TPA: hypothetical protein VK735_48000, partial [Pseudonocardia sp.]|uniref:hypothetical protein n=1 Tax=Pseudonocardia sp. TaxID=60912 RepID=UPI002CA1803B
MSGSSGLAPAGWTGIVALAGSAIVTTPDQSLAEWLAGVDVEDALESDLAAMTSPVFLIQDGGTTIAASA